MMAGMWWPHMQAPVALASADLPAQWCLCRAVLEIATQA